MGFLKTLIRRAPISRVLEVERKFLPTDASLALLRNNTGNPKFSKHVYLGHHTLDDTYFDKDNVLSPRGVYVRLRGGQWQAKFASSRSGDVGVGKIGSEAFREYDDRDEIFRVVGETLAACGKGGAGGGEESGGEAATLTDTMSTGISGLEVAAESGALGLGLRPIAQIVARRDAWDVDGFRVVVDATQWGFRVGEVELVRTVVGEEEEGVMEMMDRDIGVFMGVHGDVFPKVGEGKVEGKLSAFFRWRRERVEVCGRQLDYAGW